MNSSDKPADSAKHRSPRERSLQTTLTQVRRRRRQRQAGLAAGGLSLLVATSLIVLWPHDSDPDPNSQASLPHNQIDVGAIPIPSAPLIPEPLIQRVPGGKRALIQSVNSSSSIPRVGLEPEPRSLIRPADTQTLRLALASQPTASILVGGEGEMMQLVRFE